MSRARKDGQQLDNAPTHPEAAAIILASVYIREVPEPERKTKQDI